MKAWTGALIALLTVGLIVLGLGPRGSSGGVATQRFAQPQANGLAGAQPAMAPTAGMENEVPGAPATQVAAGTVAGQVPVLVNCGPGQQTLVRQVYLEGQVASQVECVGEVAAPATASDYRAAQVRRVPAVHTVTTTEAADGEIVRDARIVRTQGTYRAPAPTRSVTKPSRSWKKTALVIGGSTAAGAGVGGIVGGKKGALIGAAVGGGASSIYEAVKR
ncbi:MAG TPA: hypothetical protein VK911_10480 [Vicinamibacterales bacterium]|nr:hypothetical protein [Vicinamibacterales bacterium]